MFFIGTTTIGPYRGRVTASVRTMPVHARAVPYMYAGGLLRGPAFLAPVPELAVVPHTAGHFPHPLVFATRRRLTLRNAQQHLQLADAPPRETQPRRQPADLGSHLEPA